MLKPVQTVAPTVALVTREEAKRQCRLELLQPDDDAVIDGLILAATAWLDGYSGVLGRALINQTWRVNLACWPACRIRLPLAPVSVITSIKYYDIANVQRTLDTANYSLLEDALSPYAAYARNISLPALYERDDAIEVLFVAGYGAAASDVPEAIRTAAKFHIEILFDRDPDARETMEKARDALIAPFRRPI